MNITENNPPGLPKVGINPVLCDFHYRFFPLSPPPPLLLPSSLPRPVTFSLPEKILTLLFLLLPLLVVPLFIFLATIPIPLELIKFCLIIIIFGIILAFLANRKGYHPFCWFLSSSIIGLIILAFLPFTNKGDLSEKQRKTKVKKGNILGLIFSGITVVLLALKIPISNLYLRLQLFPKKFWGRTYFRPPSGHQFFEEMLVLLLTVIIIFLLQAVFALIYLRKTRWAEASVVGSLITLPIYGVIRGFQSTPTDTLFQPFSALGGAAIAWLGLSFVILYPHLRRVLGGRESYSEAQIRG